MLHSIALLVALSTGQLGYRNNGSDGGMTQQRVDCWGVIGCDTYNGSTRIRASTSEDVGLYVATTGANTNACTSSVAPCADLNGSFSKLPHFIRHGVNIHVAAGSYDAGTRFTGFEIADDGYVTIQGPDGGSLSTLASGLASGTIASYDAGPNLTYMSVTVTGAGWTADDLSDRFLFVTLPDAGRLEPTPIVSNSADTALFNTILNSAGSLVAPDVGSTFEIRQPSAVLFTLENFGFASALHLGNYSGRLHIRDMEFRSPLPTSTGIVITSGEFSIGTYPPPGATTWPGATATPTPTSPIGDRAEFNLSRSRVMHMGNGGTGMSVTGGFRVQMRNMAFFSQPITGTGVSTCYSQFGAGKSQVTDVSIVNASCTSRRVGWSFSGGLAVSLSRVSQRMFYQVNATGGGIAVSGPASILSLANVIVSCNLASGNGVEGVVNTGARLAIGGLRVSGCMNGVFTKQGGFTQVQSPGLLFVEHWAPLTGYYYSSPYCAWQVESGGRMMISSLASPALSESNFPDGGTRIGDVCVDNAQVSFAEFADGGLWGLHDLSTGSTVSRFSNF